jgi:hypothetical protein
MPELSIVTINILAWSRVVLFLFFVVGIWLIYRKKQQPAAWLFLFGLAIAVFYFAMSWPLKKMFWGDSGDEVYIFSFLTRAMSAHPFGDYFYAHLPAFYPPLYFWVTGLIARFFVHSGIGAAKIGALGVFLLWFFEVYYLQKFYWSRKANKEPIISSPWFWLALPVAAWLVNDFNDLLLKPYEAITAIFLVIWLGLLVNELATNRWTWKKYLFFGLSGGLLFLTYYFWWFMAIFALAAWIILQKKKILNLKRTLLVGLIILVVSLPYTCPLLLTYLRQGMEDWQANYFYFAHFKFFAPITILSFQGLLFILGLAGLIIYRRNKFVRINLFLFLSCYLYQILNVLIFLHSGQSFQAQKAFPLLANASLSVGLAYLLVDNGLKFSGQKYFRELSVLVLLFVAINLPFGAFIEDQVVLGALNKDLDYPSAHALAQKIEKAVPDYEQRIWLSSGAPEINAYLPLSYYLNYNPHFSHPAVHWSVRFAKIKELTKAKSPEDFQQKFSMLGQDKPNALLFYYDKASSTYPILFWQDNFPNAGKEEELKLDPKLISDKYWRKVFDNGEWKIFLAR